MDHKVKRFDENVLFPANPGEPMSKYVLTELAKLRPDFPYRGVVGAWLMDSLGHMASYGLCCFSSCKVLS